MVKCKPRAFVVLLAAFVFVAFLAHSIITLLGHHDEESFNAQQLQLQEKLEELMRLETASAERTKSMQQKIEVHLQQNLQLQASLKAANVRAHHESDSPEPKLARTPKPIRTFPGLRKRSKASPSTARTGNFKKTWGPAEKGRFPSDLYHPLPQSFKDSFEETCSKYRLRVPYNKRMLGVAGLFNAGTNLLAALLDYNCDFAGRPVNVDGGSLNGAGPVLWQVPYGKHHPSSFSGTTDAGAGDKGLWTNSGGKVSVHDMIPVVVVKDPLTWMLSMCRTRYLVEGEWYKHGSCPELINPAHSTVDVKWADHPTWTNRIPVNHSVYGNLIDFWSTWHRDYADLAEPPIFVRFEDLLFDTEAAIEPICKCAGGTVSKPVQMMTENVKIGYNLGGVSDKLHAGTKQRYANPHSRAGSYSRKDLELIRDHPVGKLTMEKFGYYVDIH